jgi:hypothetical protein
MTDGRMIDVDLDSLERDKTYPTFRFAIAGREIDFLDPANLDWQDLLKLDDETEFISLAMAKEDSKFFLEQKVEAWKVRKLMKLYQDHYELATGKG